MFNIDTISACMLDIESLDITPDATILSLGACDVEGSETFYVEFNRYQGRSVSQATLDWWDQQGVKRPEGKTDLKDGLIQFCEWYKSRKYTTVWCKGSDFDFVILSHALKTFNLETPWKYNEVRDLRTVQKMYKIPLPCSYRVHHALTDAICQAVNLREIAHELSALQASRDFIALNTPKNS